MCDITHSERYSPLYNKNRMAVEYLSSMYTLNADIRESRLETRVTRHVGTRHACMIMRWMMLHLELFCSLGEGRKDSFTTTAVY